MGSQRHEDKRLIAAWVPSHIHAELEDAKRMRGEDTTTFILRAVQQRLSENMTAVRSAESSPHVPGSGAHLMVQEELGVSYGSVLVPKRKKRTLGDSTHLPEPLPEVKEWAREMRWMRRSSRDESMDALKSEFRHWVKESEMRSFELNRRLEQLEQMLKMALNRQGPGENRGPRG